MTTLFGLLEAAAERDEGHLAIVMGEASITYGELLDTAERIASRLAEASVGPGDIVAVVAPKSIETIAALYGIMGPGPRTLRSIPMLRSLDGRRCSTIAVLAPSSTMEPKVFDAIPAGTATLDVADIRALPGPSGSRPRVGADDLAYVIYTSGSTGTPKGVKRTHRNSMVLVEWAAARFGIGPDDRVAGHTPLHFGPHRFDLYVTALAGATLYPLSPKDTRLAAQMVNHVSRHRLTVWWSAASAVQSWVRQGGFAPEDLATLRCVMFGTERLPEESWTKIPELLSRAEVYGFYGSSETGTVAHHRLGELGLPSEGALPTGVSDRRHRVPRARRGR